MALRAAPPTLRTRPASLLLVLAITTLTSLLPGGAGAGERGADEAGADRNVARSAATTAAAEPTLEVSPSAGPPGTQIEVTGEGWAGSDCGAELYLGSVDPKSRLGFAEWNGDGIAGIVTVPAEAPSGDHPVIAVGFQTGPDGFCSHSGESAAAVFTVTGRAFDVPDRLATPLQRALLDRLQSMKDEGLPAPTWTSAVNAAEVDGRLRLFSTTILEYAGPQDAAADLWPEFVVEGPGSQCAQHERCEVHPGDYDEQVIEAVEEAFPGYYDQHEYGTEPRRLVLEEQLELGPVPGLEGTDRPLRTHHETTFSEDVVFGFTLDERIDWHFVLDEEVCLFGECVELFRAECCFLLDFTFGLRLPTRVDLRLPVQAREEERFSPPSTITPLDYTAAQFEAAGIPPADGNEFAARFDLFLGARLRIAGVSVVDYAIELDEDASESFCTPFGTTPRLPGPDCMEPRREFPIRRIEVPLRDLNFLKISLLIRPVLGSDRVTARADVGGDLRRVEGGRDIAYRQPDEPVALGTLEAGDFGADTDRGTVRISGFRYRLSLWEVELGVRLEFKGPLKFIPDPGDIIFGNVDLSGLFGDLLSLGVHDGTNDDVEGSLFVESWELDIEGAPPVQPALPGSTLTYDLSVTNRGSVADSFDGIRLSPLPPGCGAGGTPCWEHAFVRSGGAPVEVVGPLAPGATDRFQLRISIPAAATPANHEFTVRGESVGARVNGLLRADAETLAIELLVPPDPDRYDLPTRNDTFGARRTVLETWEHRLPHFPCAFDKRCTEVFGSFSEPRLIARETTESWTMEVPELSFHTRSDRDFLVVPIPDPSDPAQGGHADIDPGPGTRPLPECGVLTGREVVPSVGSQDVSVLVNGSLTIEVRPTANSLSEREVGSAGEEILLYRDPGSGSPDALLGSGPALRKTIECPTTPVTEGGKGLQRLAFSFGERDGERLAPATGGYEVHLEYRIDIVRTIPDITRERGFRPMPCLWDLTGVIGPVFQPAPDFVPCIDPRFGFGDGFGPAIGLGHPFDAGRKPTCSMDGCPDRFIFHWPVRQDLGLGFAAGPGLSFRLLDTDLEMIAGSDPGGPPFDPRALAGARAARAADGEEQALFAPDLEPGFYVLEVAGPEGDYTMRFEPLETDLEVAELEVSPPPGLTWLGEPFELSLRATVRNRGPLGPIDAGLLGTATGAPLHVVAPGETAVEDLGADARAIEQSVALTCEAPGVHQVRLSARLQPISAGIGDPEPDDNTASTSLEVACALPVTINIKPGGDPNTIKLGGTTVTVAALSTKSGQYGESLPVDATAIDPTSVRFGAPDVVLAGGGAGETHGKGHIEDAFELDERTRDGDMDMVLHFASSETGLRAGDEEACLTGLIRSPEGAVPFLGCGPVQVIEPGRGS